MYSLHTTSKSSDFTERVAQSKLRSLDLAIRSAKVLDQN